FPIYGLNKAQLEIFREYFDENLKKGYIQSLRLPAEYPILFILKKNSKLRLCIDYKQFNNITIKN
ncbi:hypothetical protein M406DRAFT_243864, partial [Cryphonectria parasitica EP155]